MKRTLIIPESLEASTLSAEGRGTADLETGARLAAPRVDEFLEGAKWVLEREAEKGRQVWQDPPIYLLAMEGGIRHPRLSLLYTIAYDKVVLLSLSRGNAINQPASPSSIGPGSHRY
ncbi:MAG: hypothetical protein ABIW76_04390 [Fibrobacteria bacterium]